MVTMTVKEVLTKLNIIAPTLKSSAHIMQRLHDRQFEVSAKLIERKINVMEAEIVDLKAAKKFLQKLK